MELYQVSGVVQALSLRTTLVPMDNCPTRDDYPCLLDLDDFHGRIEVGSIFSSPSIVIKVLDEGLEIIVEEDKEKKKLCLFF